MKQNILVADDSNVARKLLEGILSEAGYIVSLAESGKQTLAALKNKIPDLILLDIYLGDINGVEVCKLIKADLQTQDIPVILISGTADANEWAEGWKQGAADCILKPFNSMELIARIQAHLTLSHTNRLLKQAEIDLHISNEKLESGIRERKKIEDQSLRIAAVAFESQEGMMVTDSNNVILRVNRAFTEITGYLPEEVIGQKPSILQSGIHHDNFYKSMWDSIQTSGFWQGEIWDRRKNGEVFPMWSTISSVIDESGAITHYVDAHIDITERKQKEQDLQLLLELTQSVAEAESFEAAIAISLRLICQKAGWEFGQAWMPSEDGSHLELGIPYYSKESNTEDFREISKRFTFIQGVGLPGRVWATKKSIWIPNVTMDSNFPRHSYASKDNLKTAMGIPVLVGNEIVTVLEFFTKELRKEDERIVSLITVFAAQLGGAFKRKLAENELAERNRFIESLIDLSPGIIYIYDLTLQKNIYSNEGIQKILGYSVEEMQAMGNQLLANLMDPDDFRNYLENTIPEYAKLADGKQIIHQYRIKHKTGIWRWLESTEAVYKRESDGSVRQIFGALQDITERKLAEITLKKSEERLRLFFERQLVGMAITSPKKGWLQVNTRICEMLGYSSEELTNLTWEELTYPDDLEADNTQFDRLLKGEINDYALEKRFVRKDGKLVYTNLAVACVRIPDGSVDYVLALVEDITERKLTERALLESEGLFRDVINNATTIIFLKDTSGKYLHVNHEFEKRFHLTNSTIKGKTDYDLFSKDIADAFTSNDRMIIARGHFLEMEEYIEDTDGIHTYSSIKFPIKNINNEIYGICGLATDITARKKAEVELERHRNRLEELVKDRTLDLEQTIKRLQETQSQLVQSEKLASLGILTAGIAHEINNPVNYINSSIVSLEMLATELIDILKIYETITEENIHEKLEEIKELKENVNLLETIEGITILSENIKVGARKTSDIVKSLRIFSRTDSDNPALADVNENIDSTLILLHNQYIDRIKIIKLYEQLPPIKCFSGKLNQVFMNLLANAIQAIEGKGTITIKTQYMPNGNQSFKKECIFISIRDTGYGIPLEIQNKVFEPFFTTKDIGKGTGLGLAISYGIVEQHRGKMEFTSEDGRGTEFNIYLPL